MRGVLAIAAAVMGLWASGAYAGEGEPFGTRDPATCEARTGPLSAQNAAQYFACDTEGVSGDEIYLVTNVKVQIAPKGRPFNIVTDSWSGIDPSQLVYDIRGSFRNWQCSAKNSLAWENNPGSACNYGDQPSATGECYVDTFGEWHCHMLDVAHAGTTVSNVPPPQ